MNIPFWLNWLSIPSYHKSKCSKNRIPLHLCLNCHTNLQSKPFQFFVHLLIDSIYLIPLPYCVLSLQDSSHQVDIFRDQIVRTCDSNADGKIGREEFKLIINLHTNVDLYWWHEATHAIVKWVCESVVGIPAMSTFHNLREVSLSLTMFPTLCTLLFHNGNNGTWCHMGYDDR